MDQQIKKQWVEALRSGKYKQGREYLRTELSDGSYSYCCLGVLCDIREVDLWNSLYPSYDDGELPNSTILDKVKLDFYTAQELADMNDEGSSFGEISDWIETNL
jgi:hypothetical protein